MSETTVINPNVVGAGLRARPLRTQTKGVATEGHPYKVSLPDRQSSLLSWAGVSRLSDSFVWGSLLLLGILVAVPYGTVEPWWIAVFECCVFALTAFAVLHKFVGRSAILSRSSSWFGLLVPVIVLAFFAFFQSVAPAGSINAGSESRLSADAFETRLWAVKLMAYAFFAALLFSYTSSQRRLRALVYTVVGLGVASAIFGLLRQGLQHEAGFLLPYLHSGSGYAQFINKNHFAFLIEMALGLLVGLVLGGGVRKRFWPIPAAAVVLLWTALVMTSSRGAIFTTLGQIAFGAIILMITRSRQQPAETASGIHTLQRSNGRFVAGRLLLIVFIMGVVGVSAVWLGGDLLTTRIKSLSGEVSGPNGEIHAGVRRQEVWRSTVALIKAHPIVGNGLGAYSVAITPFHDGSGKWTPEAAHNDYLELAASGGVIAVGLVLWFAIVLVRRAKVQLRQRDPFARAACLGAVTGLFGVAAHSVVDFGLHVTINTVVFIMLVVIATREFQRAASGGSVPVKV